MNFSDYWDSAIHNEPSQVTSRMNAKKIKSSEIENLTEDSCDITGSSKYHVSLSSCQCRDFLVTKKGLRPCKHIYRLAAELGIFELLPKKNPSGAAAMQAEIPNELARWEREFLAGNISPEKYIRIVEALQTK